MAGWLVSPSLTSSCKMPSVQRAVHLQAPSARRDEDPNGDANFSLSSLSLSLSLSNRSKGMKMETPNKYRLDGRMGCYSFGE